MDINTKIFRDNFLQYYRPLCLFALHYLKDIDDAEDAVQDCFMELWKRKEKGFELKGHWHKEFFKNDNPIVLELGCGKGEYTVELARLFPDKNFIGVDIKGARMWTGAKDSYD